MEAAIEALCQAGAEVIDGVDIPSQDYEWDWHVLSYEFKTDVNAYLSTVGPNVPVHSLADVIAFNEANSEACLKYGQVHMTESEGHSGTLTEPGYLTRRERDIYLSQAGGIDHVLQEHQLDALLTPGNWGADIP